MKICIYSDVHFCEYSSIVRSHGERYSTRLENLIKTLNWAEAEAIRNNCDQVICLGDFFDRPDLNSRELTALQEINWANIPHTFIVGNHEASSKSLKYNSVSALQSFGFEVITTPKIMICADAELLMLPYCLEEDRKSLAECWNGCDDLKNKRIILSHNDIQGIRYGAIESKEGIKIADIQENCDLFLNGHLHNGSAFASKCFNVGNLTGQNFGEDAFNYPHCLYILDTTNNSLESIENPFALNFYKIECINSNDINKLLEIKSNAVVSIKCLDSLKAAVQELLDKLQDKIIESRITIIRQVSETDIDAVADLSVDHLTRFAEFCRQRIDNTDALEVEIAEVCK